MLRCSQCDYVNNYKNAVCRKCGLALVTNKPPSKPNAVIAGVIIGVCIFSVGIFYKTYYYDYWQEVYSGNVKANRNSAIYHLPKCMSYESIGKANLIEFRSTEQAELLGYRPAENCPKGVVAERKQYEKQNPLPKIVNRKKSFTSREKNIERRTTERKEQPAPRTFKGYECTSDCSGHQAGYDWAEGKGSLDADDCGGRSQSFIEGCKAYANEE